ncbi:MAG: hypothetical protein A4E51_00730 [Methanosaeta sp. PtaU1.Bin055]|nr:MAG: hypothetical protein A4E51_00730 [Methanosaeta sp. PtaU1.Bin055]
MTTVARNARIPKRQGLNPARNPATKTVIIEREVTSISFSEPTPPAGDGSAGPSSTGPLAEEIAPPEGTVARAARTISSRSFWSPS